MLEVFREDNRLEMFFVFDDEAVAVVGPTDSVEVVFVLD